LGTGKNKGKKGGGEGEPGEWGLGEGNLRIPVGGRTLTKSNTGEKGENKKSNTKGRRLRGEYFSFGGWAAGGNSRVKKRKIEERGPKGR